MNFRDTVTAAVRDFTEHGYDSPERLAYWTEQLRAAAAKEMISDDEMAARLGSHFEQLFKAQVRDEGILRHHRDIPRFTFERLKPDLRAEMDRRLYASRQLIKLNRSEAMDKMERRFAGWGTSIPAGGSRVVDKVAEKQDIRKSLYQLPFVERRLMIDQGHKMVAALSETLANDGGALAGVWNSVHRPGYNNRVTHLERDGKTYAVRGNWAIEAGLMNKGDGYIDEFERVGEFPYCSCFMRWIYYLKRLPEAMLTAKGRAELAAPPTARLQA